MSDFDGIRGLVFDVFGTVVDWRGGVIRAGEEIGRDHSLDIDWPHFADEWRGRYVPSMNRVRNGEVPWKNLDALHRESLEELLVEFGIGGVLAEFEKDWFVKAWHRLDPWPDSVDGLRLLGRGRIVSPLSNGNVALLTNMAKRTGLGWDVILSAEIAHHYKPDPETYLLMPSLFDFAPSEVMMVAAHPEDLVAAASHGLRTAYIHRPHEFGSNVEVAWPDEDFDVKVESLIGLYDVIRT